MQKIEEIWNIVFFSLYIGLSKVSSFIKTPLDYFIDFPQIKKIITRRGTSTDIVKETSRRMTENTVLGTSIFYANHIMIMSLWGALFGIDWIIAILVFRDVIVKREIIMIEIFLVVLGINLILSFGLHYYFTEYKNKYHRYFMIYKKKTHRWKKKWVWITVGIVSTSFLMIALAVIIQNAVLK